MQRRAAISFTWENAFAATTYFQCLVCKNVPLLSSLLPTAQQPSKGLQIKVRNSRLESRVRAQNDCLKKWREKHNWIA